jgi:hypothetical protein
MPLPTPQGLNARALLTGLALALVLGAAPAAQSETPVGEEAGRLLAGRAAPGEKASKERKKLMSWYARRMAKHWAHYEEKIGTPLKTWAKANVPEIDGGVVFYPFGGPDLATVYRVFPKADRYVLVALQRAGRTPALREASDRKLKEVLKLFDTGLKQFSLRGFFLTKEMNRLFDWGHTVEGMTGVIAVFAELEGFDILKIEPVRVHPETGFVEAHPGGGTHRKHWVSVRFFLQERESQRTVIVDYLRVNLYDEYLRKIVGQVKFIERMSIYPSFLKAASHLMQQDGFHDIRDALLENSPLIVQDESGLGFPALDEAFDVKLFGKFTTMNKLFRKDVEWKALRAAYAKREVAGPVDFTIGYQKPAGSCLMVATRKARESPDANPAEGATPTPADAP